MAIADILKGPVRVLYAPLGTDLPDASVGVEKSWGTEWKELGYTQAPLSANYETEEGDIRVEQALAAVDRYVTSESLTLETTLSELTADNVELVMGGALNKTVSKEEVKIGGKATLAKRMWGFEGVYEKDNGDRLPVRFFVYKATARLNGALEFGKSVENGTGIALQVNALQDMAQDHLFKFERVLGESGV